MVEWRQLDLRRSQLVASTHLLYAGKLRSQKLLPIPDFYEANLISSSVALALGRPGARYHIGYPVLARSVFGMYGQFFFVWIRAVVAIIW